MNEKDSLAGNCGNLDALEKVLLDQPDHSCVRFTLGDQRRPPRVIADLSMRFGKYFTKIDFYPGNPIDRGRVPQAPRCRRG